MSEKPKTEKSLRAKSPRQKFEDMKVLMSEKPKAEKSLQAKSPRQKFEDIKVLMSEKSLQAGCEWMIFLAQLGWCCHKVCFHCNI